MKNALIALLAALAVASALPAAANSFIFQLPTMTFADEMTPAPLCDPATATQAAPCPTTGR